MAPPPRNKTLDILKGVAIVLMVQVHCYGWWLDPSLRALPLFTISLVLGWFAGPLFLFSIGCALALSVQRRHRAGQSCGAITFHVLRRAALIFLGGYVLNAVTFAGTARSNIQSVGVLQCIGISIVVSYAALCWLPRWTASLLAIAVVLLTPLLRAADLFSESPVQALLVNVPYDSNYALFPWVAYALIGVDVGRLLTRSDEHCRQLGTWLRRLMIVGAPVACLCGTHVARYILALSGGRFPTEADVQIPFWYPFPTFSFFHCGCLLVAFATLTWVLPAKETGSTFLSPLAVTGRAALLVFVAHHILGYRMAYSLGYMDGVYGTMSARHATIGVLLMLVISWLAATVWLNCGNRLRQRFGRRHRRGSPTRRSGPG
jgi:uncharacterized membrane protein